MKDYPRKPVSLRTTMPRPYWGWRHGSFKGWSWAQEQEGGPWLVRDPEGVLVARATNWWTAARWACAQEGES